MSAMEAVDILNEQGMNKRMLKPMHGKHHSDTKLPVAQSYSYCPYSKNIACPSDTSYRTFDGTCNNLKNPLIGRAMTPFRRLMPAKYADG